MEKKQFNNMMEGIEAKYHDIKCTPLPDYVQRWAMDTMKLLRKAGKKGVYDPNSVQSSGIYVIYRKTLFGAKPEIATVKRSSALLELQKRNERGLPFKRYAMMFIEIER